MRKWVLALVMAALSLVAPTMATGPEGFGSATTGGAGYPVVYVTNTLDYDVGLGEPVIPGSLREALSSNNRVVQFMVGGSIDLKWKMEIRNRANITVDGGSAPWPGITLLHDQLEIRGSTNIIVQNIRVRDTKDRGLIPGIMVYRANDRIWVDHCTVTRAGDESIGVYGGDTATGGGRPTNVTVSWNLVADSETPVTGKGILISGVGSGDASVPLSGVFATQVSVHHNFLSHNGQRNPQVSGNVNDPVFEPLVDIRNNIFFEWVNYGTRFRWNASGNLIKNIYMSSTVPGSALLVNLPGPLYINGNMAPLVGEAQADINTFGNISAAISVPPITEHSVCNLPIALFAWSGVGALPRDAYDEAIIARDGPTIVGSQECFATGDEGGGGGCGASGHCFPWQQ